MKQKIKRYRTARGLIAFVVLLTMGGSISAFLRSKRMSEPEDGTWETPFQMAEHGDLESLKKLVQKDPTIVHKTNITGMTVLHYAAMGNQPHVIRYLVKQGAKVDQLDETRSNTPLFQAAMSPKAHAVKAGRVLIELGADPQWRLDGRKATYSVLDKAAQGGHAGLVKLLLKKGATPFTWSELPGRKYLVRTSLHHACRGPIASMYLLPPSFAKPGRPSLLAEYEDNHKVIELLVPVVKDVNIKDVDGRTPLHVAAMRGNDKIAAYLLKKYPQVDINSRDKRLNTPLHMAVKAAVSFAKDHPKRSLKRHVATISVILKYKPDLTIKNFFRQTPRDLARASGNKAIMALFP